MDMGTNMPENMEAIMKRGGECPPPSEWLSCEYPLGMMQTLCLPRRTFPRLNQLSCLDLAG